MENIDRLILGNIKINSILSKFDQSKLIGEDKVDVLVVTELKLMKTFFLASFLLVFQRLKCWIKIVTVEVFCLYTSMYS